MPHPSLGLPPGDALAGQPDVAGSVRSSARRLPAIALQAALRIDPTLADRHDRFALRRFLGDYEAHLEQLLRALASGDDRALVTYGEAIVPIYRRRQVSMNDVVTLLRGLEEAIVSVVPVAQAGAVRGMMSTWVERTRHHRRLPGDHRGNPIVRFFWKGAGLGDDSVV